VWEEWCRGLVLQQGGVQRIDAPTVAAQTAYGFEAEVRVWSTAYVIEAEVGVGL
jgi:hypothetical protein